MMPSSRWFLALVLAASAAMAGGCRETSHEPSAACALVGDLVDEITGTSEWVLTEDTLTTDEGASRARCGISTEAGDVDRPFIQIKAAAPSDPAVTADNIRQQLDDPDVDKRLSEPCTEYRGDPGVGVGCDMASTSTDLASSSVYVSSDDTSISVVVAGWPGGATPVERRDAAESLTRTFLAELAEHHR